MSGAYCPKCPCPSCERARDFLKPRDPYDGFTDYGTPGPAPGIDRWTGEPTIVRTGAGDPECAYERIAREYAARGERVPVSLLLYCGCRRCSPIC